jgi:transposase
MDEFSRRLVPDGLWEIAGPLIPASPRRAQGGGIRRVDDRQVFAAIVFVLTTGCAWRHLPPVFGVSHQTAHRRFTEWSEAALGAAPSGRARPARRRRRDRLVAGDRRRGESARQKGGSLTGPNPVDRGKPGSKIHVLSDRAGLPLALGVSGANLHDSQAFEPLIQGIPKVRSRQGL